MLFSIFNLLGYRDRGTPIASLYDNAIDAVKHAEQAGFEIA